MALPAHDSLTYLAADQALCNLSSLVVFRSVWDDPDDTDFDLDKAAIRQLNILDCLIPKMNLQELIKTLKFQRDMKAATCNSRLWAEEELELSDQMVHSIYKAFGTNRFAATEDEYLEAIKNLDLMDKDDYGIKLAISRLTDRITKLQAAPCDDVTDGMNPQEALERAERERTTRKLEEDMGQKIVEMIQIECIRDAEKRVAKRMEKAPEMTSLLPKLLAKKLNIAEQEVEAIKADLESMRARWLDDLL